MDNPERIRKALELLKQGLRSFVERELQAVHKDKWLEIANLTLASEPSASKTSRDPNHWDVQALLLLIWNHKQWHDVFKRILSQDERTLVSELRNVRNKWAHQESFAIDDTYRAVDSVYRLLTAVSSPEAVEVDKQRQELLRMHIQNQNKGEIVTHDSSPTLGEDMLESLGTLPYDMGNAGDLVKHGLLAEFTQWWCAYVTRPLRFLDPFAGLPWIGSPKSTVVQRLQALPQCAIRDAQPDPVSKYYGSSYVVLHAARAAGSSAEVLISDAEPTRIQAFRKLGFKHIACREFSSINGYSILNVDIDADLVLLDPFSRFLPDHALDVIPKIAAAAKRIACVLFVLNLNPNNYVGRRYDNLRLRHLPVAWALHCPKLPDQGILGESNYEVDVLLAWDSLLNHPARDVLRERLERYAIYLSRVLNAKITFSDSAPKYSW